SAMSRAIGGGVRSIQTRSPTTRRSRACVSSSGRWRIGCDRARSIRSTRRRSARRWPPALDGSRGSRPPCRPRRREGNEGSRRDVVPSWRHPKDDLPMSWRIGVDIGGTFTDVVVVDESRGGIAVVKVPTTPRDFCRGVVDALGVAMRERGLSPTEVTWLAHATTVVTNALLEGKGARRVLVTTRGMRDVLELRRSARASLYDLFQDGPATLVPRHLRLEVTERVDAQGAVVAPLSLDEVDDAVDFIKRHNVEAVPLCLPYALLDDSHERQIGARLRAALPDLPVFLSSKVLPEIREFARARTTP